MTDERIDTLIRKLPEPSAAASLGAPSAPPAVLAHAQRARREDRTWLGRLVRDLRLGADVDGLREVIRMRPILSVAVPLVVGAAVLGGVLAIGSTTPKPQPSTLRQPSAAAVAPSTQTTPQPTPPSPSPVVASSERGVVVFSTSGRIAVADGDGSNRRELTDGTVTDYAPAWSPDGTKIAFFSQACKASETCPNKTDPTSLVLIDADGSNRRTLRTGMENPSFLISWLPDGSAIDVSSFGATGQIYEEVGLDGSTKPMAAPARQARFVSPDGTLVARVADGIVIEDADGSQRHLFAPPANKAVTSFVIIG